MENHLNIAVLLPCYNEAATIQQVVTDFRTHLPHATVYVYDNCSTDNTAELAKQAGAVVRAESRQGKGNVVRRMFADIDADIYVLADGDLAHDAQSALTMIDTLINNNLDMIVGTRPEVCEDHRKGHRFGNQLFNKVVGLLFGKQFSDILSGYRVLSKRFVKSFPAVSRGFDTEVELTIHSLELRLPVAEVPTNYTPRPEGSVSKLRTYRDGVIILSRILLMLKETKPILFFGAIGLSFALLSVILGIPLIYTFLKTHLVPRIPTAILTTGIMVLAFISLTCGIILDSVCRARRERKYLHYLTLPKLRKLP